VSVSSPNVARQRLDKHVLAATNIHGTVEELLDSVFCAVRVVSDPQSVVKGKQAISSSQKFF
jgi:hypothetical protein